MYGHIFTQDIRALDDWTFSVVLGWLRPWLKDQYKPYKRTDFVDVFRKKMRVFQLIVLGRDGPISIPNTRYYQYQGLEEEYRIVAGNFDCFDTAEPVIFLIVVLFLNLFMYYFNYYLFITKI